MCAMSASVEDSMDVDEENNMQVDEDNATGELPMSTDEDSVQDTGGAMKVTDIPMVSDCTDVDISEGPRAESDGPTEMESDNLTEEVGNLSSVKFGDKSGEDTGLQETVEPVLESGADTLRDDGSPLCHTTIEQTVSSSNVSEAAEEHVGETETNPERASTTNVDSHIVEKNNPGDDGSLSGENEAEQEQMVENTVGNDETSQNNGGDDQDPLNSEQDSRNDVDSGENSNVTSVSATEENARDSFAQDGDGSSNAAPEQLMTAPHEDSIPASDDGESSSSSANDNKGVGEGKSVDEELSEQLELVQPMTAPDEDSAPASDVGESCSNIGNDNKDMGEGKSLAEELSEHVDLVQRVTAPDEDSAPASDVGEPNSNIDNDNRDMGEGKSLAEELREQVDLVQQMAVPDEDSAAASDLVESSSNIGNDNKDVGEGKSLAEELNEKPADDDHISIDDASSVGGVDAENADHVSIDGSSEGERVVDHVSVDSDSDIEDTISDVKASSSTKTSKGRNDDGSVAHTVPVDDEVEETAGVDNDSEKPTDGDPTQLMIDVASAVEAADASIQDEDKASNGTQKTNTVDLVDSDDDSALPTSSFSIRPRSSESLRGHITLIGKAADTETIISDDPVSTRSATVVVLDAPKPATPSQNSSNADPSTHSSVPSDSARAMKTVYSVKKIGTPTQWKCLQCSTYQRCPWKVTIGASSQYICSDKCLEAHRVQRRQIIESGGPPATHIIQIADVSNLKKKCALCAAYIPKNKVGCLTWEVMNFCDEDCLSKHQAAFTSHCCNCEAVVTTSSMGKYCVRFGHEVKQFCTPLCLDTYKKGIKTCSYCQKNLQDSSEGFLAAVGGKDQFRDFCSQDCLEKYDCICNNSSHAYSVANCIVCDNVKVTQFELLSTSKVAKLCSDVCLAAYKFVNNIEVGICGMCNKYYDTLGVDECVTFNNDIPSTFCSKHCMNINVISKRKIVPCAWCKAKKYNFDMVYRRGANDDESLFVCSVNCLALHSVSLKALPPKKVNCSYCKKLDVSTYHITMSDASVRHFCSYDCVLSFQSAFNVPVLNANIPVPEGAAKKIVRPADATVSSPTSTLAMPTIQSVGTLKAIDPINPPALVPQSTPANKVKHTTLKIPASFCSKPPEMRNRWTQISVCRSTKCVSCKPKKEEKDVQCDLVVEPVNGETSSMTDSAKENGNVGTSQTKAVIPIPVPIYVPHPMAMFTLPTPIAIPIPVPIIVPIIIPTSLENMDRVIDTMKEILEKSMRENQSSTMGQSSAIDEVLQMVRSGTDSGGEGKKRVMDHGDSDEDLVPPKRARLAEDKSCSDTSETQANMKLKFMLGPNTWKHFAKNWNESLGDNDEPLKLDILAMRPRELSSALAVFVREARKANGDEYRPDLKFYLCLGIQYYLFENSRVDDIFGDTTYEEFTDALDVEARKFNSSINSMVSRVEEEHLWESMQLGAKSPQVLLLTLMYFITLRFNLWTLEEHMQLSFNTFSKEIKSSSSDKAQGGKVIRLVLNSSSGNMSDGAELKKQREFEFTENKKDIMRCPVRLYEFYITKCPENIKTHSDRFYLMPETSCLPESPVWYRSLALPPQMLEKMLNRVKMIKEVRESMSGQYGPTDQETC